MKDALNRLWKVEKDNNEGMHFLCYNKKDNKSDQRITHYKILELATPTTRTHVCGGKLWGPQAIMGLKAFMLCDRCAALIE